MKKPRLVILSDLWGEKRWSWLNNYLVLLTPYFDIQIYDICQLAGINTYPYIQNTLHQQFLAGGIDRAVQQLLLKEKTTVSILAFSMGGTIAWKAVLKGLPVKVLYAISATRLRYEEKNISCGVHLYYGENDTYQPSKTWKEKMKLPITIYPLASHELYMEDKWIPLIVGDIIDTKNIL